MATPTYPRNHAHYVPGGVNVVLRETRDEYEDDDDDQCEFRQTSHFATRPVVTKRVGHSIRCAMCGYSHPYRGDQYESKLLVSVLDSDAFGKVTYYCPSAVSAKAKLNELKNTFMQKVSTDKGKEKYWLERYTKAKNLVTAEFSKKSQGCLEKQTSMMERVMLVMDMMIQYEQFMNEKQKLSDIEEQEKIHLTSVESDLLEYVQEVGVKQVNWNHFRNWTKSKDESRDD
jgi:hypothetical protein